MGEKTIEGGIDYTRRHDACGCFLNYRHRIWSLCSLNKLFITFNSTLGGTYLCVTLQTMQI